MKKYAFIGIAFFLVCVMLFGVSSFRSFGSKFSDFSDKTSSLYHRLSALISGEDKESATDIWDGETIDAFFYIQHEGKQVKLGCIQYLNKPNEFTVVTSSDVSFVPLNSDATINFLGNMLFLKFPDSFVSVSTMFFSDEFRFERINDYS